MQEYVDHFLLLQSGLEHLFRISEHSEPVVTLSHRELPIPILVLA